MKKRILLTLLCFSSLSLTSCGGSFHYADHLDDYVFTMRYHEDFNILQLSDIHWNMNTSTLASRGYLDKLFKYVDQHIKDADPNGKIDLVELTGDQFMLANAYHIESFIRYFEEKAEQYGFRYASIWGNHDRHGIYNPNWLSEQFAKAPHSIYLDAEDDLYGRSNFVINLTTDGEKTGATKWQLANLDSGASFSETAISPFRDYDYIRADQVDWWLKEHEKVGENVPAIAYYHIPQDDNGTAYKLTHPTDGSAPAAYKNKFFKLEGFADNGNEQYASQFIKQGRNHNLKAAFMGHAHNVDWTVDYDGVVLGLGVKTGPELYYAHIKTTDTDPRVKEGLDSIGMNEDFDLLGAALVTIKDEANFELEHFYLNERPNGDFTHWARW